MKRYKRRRLTKLSLEILQVLSASGMVASMLMAPSMGLVFKKFLYVNSKDERQKIRRAVENLKKHDLIEVRPGGSYIENEIRLSRAGKELLETESLKLPMPKKWDGKWRLIMFDIPEPFKMARRALSLKLRELGCYHYQNSVFVYPYDCRREIDLIRDYFGFGSGIRYVEASRLDDQEAVEDFFKL